MKTATYLNFKQHLDTFMNAISTSRLPLLVTRPNGEDVVVMSKADYESIQETLYLLGSAKNAERLAKGIAEFEQGQGEVHDLIEE